ncbi:MAG: cytochrome b/b6 domain-containing protein [Pseudomonadota bacterium]
MNGYTRPARWLHWLIAGLIVLQYVLAEAAENADAAGTLVRELALLAHHKSVGMTVLALAVLRLAWRLMQSAPPHDAALPLWQRRSATAAHWLLYALIFALPISGWLMSSATAYSVSWFNLFAWPDLVAPDEALADRLHEVHETLAKLLLVTAAVHVIAALKHALFDRDGVLGRMTDGAALSVTGVGGGALLWWMLTPATGAAPVADPAAGTTASPTTPVAMPDRRTSTLPRWQIDFDNSHIRFSAEQAGAPFTGQWTDWDAEIAFDPSAPAESFAVVRIRTNAVASGDAERDDTIVGPAFFAAAEHPDAQFEAQEITRTGAASYLARGPLTIKGISIPIEFTFAVEDGAIIGSAQLDRLLFELGTGDWQDTSWVGQFVEVDVRVQRAAEP